VTRPVAGSDLAAERYDRDDDLLAAVGRDGRPRLRVAGVPHVAVVLGRGSRPARELRLAAVLADRVPVLTRPGGGCAVVLDPGNLVVSVVLPLPGVGGIRGAFARLTTWLCAGLARSGVTGVARGGVSDLVLDDRKVGGSAIYRRRGLLYYSSTLLVAPDLDLVDRYLMHPPREPAYRRGRPHREFMGSLNGAGLSAGSQELRDRLDRALALADLDLAITSAPRRPAGG
jgi:lipoate-protein ligase A